MEMRELRIDCRRMTTREQAHDYLAEILNLPSYYGRNLDALYDCVGDLHGVRIVLEHPATLYALGDYRRALLSVFCDIASDSESIELLLRGGTAEEEPAQQPESGEPAAGSTAIQ